jgi:hypothetical protein
LLKNPIVDYVQDASTTSMRCGKKNSTVPVWAAPVDEVIELLEQKFVDRLHTTSTLFAEKIICRPSATATSFSGSLEPHATACQNQTSQVSKCDASFCGHQHFRLATPANLILNPSTFPILRLALAGAART